MKYHHLFITICLFFSISNLGYASEFGPFQGKIIDAETKESIEGVVVLIEWRQYRLSSLFENTIFYDAQETLTDKSGEFYMSGIWVLNPWTRLMLEASVIIYKSGYYEISSVPWKALLHPWREPIAGERKSYVSEVENGKPVIILKKVTDVEERRKNIPSQPSAGEKYHQVKKKWKLLRLEINKEYKSIGLDESIDSDGFGR